MRQKTYGPPRRTHAPQYPSTLEAIENRRNRVVANEYLASISAHLQTLENSSQASAAMIDLQPEVKWFMRPYLVNFIIQMHASLKLKPQTLFLCWNIIDRYCAKRIAFKQHYQLIGCTALWIAAKYEDKKSRVPTVSELSLMCSNVYDESMFKEMEIHILSTLGWSIGHTSLEDILQLSIKFCDHDGKETLAKPLDQYKSNSPTVSAILAISRYLCELSLYERNYLNYKTSMIGIAAHLMACSMLKLETGSSWLESVYVHYYNSKYRTKSKHQLPTPVTPSKSFKYFNDETSDIQDADMDHFRSTESINNAYGPFINGFEGLETISQLRQLSLMLLKSLLNPAEVLIEKYSQLGVITVIQNFITENHLEHLQHSKELDDIENLSPATADELSNLLLNLEHYPELTQLPRPHAQFAQIYHSPTLNKSTSSPFNSPSKFSSFSSVSSQTTCDSSYEELAQRKMYYQTAGMPRYPDSSPILNTPQ
ncbi:hypothetical protein KL905_001749 [Ogataea polymorpha]|nr:hypothetical protein KL935_000330 [Ogataea polymorpha]KAG7908308.1 hypothetical protein KL907_001798 [Ogataea polymorpha]KAG7908962.1 hypothetical protein KL906_003193 [Ogataea polymorpha]KAG7921081.1 hypothetical protein KL927_000325 [Ogataea polymorpha]KAG7922528.1 hypothetical protein KL905_001749 [Ogataea polymorpha]